MLTLNILMQLNNDIYMKKNDKRIDSYLVNTFSHEIRKKEEEEEEKNFPRLTIRLVLFLYLE